MLVTRAQSAWSTPGRMVDVDAKALLAGHLERQHLDARNPDSTFCATCLYSGLSLS